MAPPVALTVVQAAAFRRARAAEGVYAAAALVLAFGLPWPPPGELMVTAVHWLGTGFLAAMLAVKLGRPNGVLWWVAALLAAYTLANGLVVPARLFAGRSGMTTAAVVALVIWGSQLLVAVTLFQTRALRRMDRSMARRR